MLSDEDFYRFTRDGLRWLLSAFNSVEIHTMGGFPYRMLHTIIPMRLRQAILNSQVGMALLNLLDKRWPTPSPLRWLAVAKK